MASHSFSKMQPRKILKEPLFHFLVIAIGIFIVFDFLHPSGDDGSSKTITVYQSDLIDFMQYRAKAFDPISIQEEFALLSAQERRQLINDYIREEALYREAKGLGLEKNDYLQRLRMIQKLEFVVNGLVQAVAQPSKEEVEQYFERHKSKYSVPAKITFTHVFFSNERHGAELADTLASQMLEQLNASNIKFHQATEYGDRYLYNVNYVQKDQAFVARHFGREMAHILFQLDPANQRWRGNFHSPHGVHLVMLTNLSKAHTPAFEDIFDRVKADAVNENRNLQMNRAMEEIVATYDVQLSDDLIGSIGVVEK